MAIKGRKEPIFTDMIKSIALIDQRFQWSVVYERNVHLFMEEKNSDKIFPNGLVGCMCPISV